MVNKPWDPGFSEGGGWGYGGGLYLESLYKDRLHAFLL